MSANSTRIVLAQAPDIVASLGRPGAIDQRGSVISIVHEPPRRVDVLAQAVTGATPPTAGATEEITAWLERANHTASTDDDVCLTVISMLPDITGPAPWKSSATGWLAHPPAGWQDSWSAASVQWFEETFQPAPPLETGEWFEALRSVAEGLTRGDRELFVYNVSTYDPEDTAHDYRDIDETFAMRSNRMLAMLETLAGDLDFKVVDVDVALAELGAAAHVDRAGSFSDTAGEFIAEEAIRAIDDSGALASSMQAPVMRLVVPAFDRRTTEGTIVEWRTSPGEWVEAGSPLFDVYFERHTYRFDAEHRSRRNRTRKRPDKREKRLRGFAVSVVAGSDARLGEVLKTAGDSISTGDTVALMTLDQMNDTPAPDDVDATFRVGVRLSAE